MRPLLRFTLPVLSTVLLTRSLAADVLVSFSPVAQTVLLGDSASVDVTISNLPPHIGDFDFTVLFNQTILSLPNPTNVTFGTSLGDPTTEAITGETDSSGSVEFFEVSLLSPADVVALQTTSSFTAATITFGTIGLGTSPLDIDNVTLGDENGSPVSFTLQSGSITVVAPQPIPEPGFLIPVGIALAMLCSGRSYRRNWPFGLVVVLLWSKPLAAQPSLPMVLGPSAAPITIIEFTDFECPFCGKQALILRQLLQNDPGHVRFLFHNNPLPVHPHAFLAHEAALAAGEQGKFWEMHDLLFANQSRLTKDDLMGYGQQLGLDLNALRQALESHRYAPLIERDLAEAKALGVSGTPTFLINGRKVVGVQSAEQMHALIYSSLISGLPSASPPDPGPKNITVGQSPVRGAPQAVITLVEFADLECPYCRTAQPEIAQLLREYPNDVRLVFKNFPLDIHPGAQLVHEAALAAGAHGKFWEMHDWIYAHRDSVDRKSLIQAARELGLNVEQFAADLDQHKYRGQVADDIAEGNRLGVDGTPTFFINGQELGADATFAGFRQVVDRQLKVAASKAGGPGGE
jgi:protein-disulfide isomerase